MNPRMRFLLFTLLVMLGLGLLGLLFVRSQGVNPDQHQKIVAHLAAMRELDPAIDRRMLQIRHGAITSNDALVADVNALVAHVEALKETDLVGLAKTYPELASELATLGGQVEEKIELVENFKSYNAVAGNSLRFLNSYTHLLAKTKGVEQITGLAEKLQRQILLLRLGRNDLVSLQAIEDLRAKLQTEAIKSGERFHRNALVIARHAEVIVLAESDMSKVMSRLLLADSALGKALSDSYNRVLESELHRANVYRHLLFLFALALMFAVLFGFIRLRESTRLLRATLHDLEFQKFALDQHGIVSVTDVKGNILYVNDRFCSISGYEREELIGKNHRLIKSSEHSADFYQLLWRTIGQGHVWHGEVCNTAKNGSNYWVSATIVPFLNDQGKPFKYVSIRTDITLQKILEREFQKNQQFLESITETLGEAIYVEDASGKCVFMNKQAEHVLGWQRADLLGRSVHEAIHYRKADGCALSAEDCQIRQTTMRGEIYSSEDESFVHKDGQIFPVQITAVALRDEGQYSGVVAVFQDITKRLEARAELTEAKLAADQASQAKSMFLANMSHEIRTPMNAIIGLSHLCLDTELDKKQQDYVQKIHNSGQMLLGILNDILDFSKIEAGKMTLEFAPFSLEALIDQVWIFATHQAMGKQVSLTKTFTGEIPPCLLGDSLRLGQVLTNLLGNACKFTEVGAVSLNIHGGRRMDNCVDLSFSIQDTGIGMTAEQVGRLFNAFTQAESGTTRRFGGTGLGLSISERLVTLMGGQLCVESQKGEGSRFFFTVTLPLSVFDESTARAMEMEADLSNLRVLLAEDNEINKQIAVELLKRKGVEVTVVDNGKAAIDALEGVSPSECWDLVLMDIQMPVMDGYQATKLIRQRTEFDALPVIAMTANVTQEEIQSMLALGMNDHVAKPIRPKLLYEALARWGGVTKGVLVKSDTQAEVLPAYDDVLMDSHAAIERLGDDPELYEMLLGMWVTNEADTPNRMSLLIGESDWAEAERLAHTIKGTAASLGLVSLENHARRIEDTCRVKYLLSPDEMAAFIKIFELSREIAENYLSS